MHPRARSSSRACTSARQSKRSKSDADRESQKKILEHVQVLKAQLRFRKPFPPNLGLSRQFLQAPQSWPMLQILQDCRRFFCTGGAIFWNLLSFSGSDRVVDAVSDPLDAGRAFIATSTDAASATPNTGRKKCGAYTATGSVCASKDFRYEKRSFVITGAS